MDQNGSSCFAIDLQGVDVTYRLEVWQAPDGTVIRAALPPSIVGAHFGPSVLTMVHNLYANGMTQPAIFDFMLGVGIDVSEGQIHNMLVGEAKQYQQQSEAILSAGIQEAPYIRTYQPITGFAKSA
jgi:hypothetical protein